MASAYEFIATKTVTGATQANLEFTGIPATYQDLYVILSCRTNDTSGAVWDSVVLYLNNDKVGSYCYMYGVGPATGQARTNSGDMSVGFGATSSLSTAKTFSNAEAYIFNYTGSGTKNIWTFGVAENNSTTAGLMSLNNNGPQSGVVNALKFVPTSGASFVQYSTISLYGIKK
jgi:hypothetical protein